MGDPISLFLLALRFAMMVSLYTFFAIFIFIIWQDSKQNASQINTHIIPTIILEINNQSVYQITFTSPIITIGRDSMNECLLDSGTVSQHHAKITNSNKQWWIEDLESTNGTFLNDSPVNTRTVITLNDEIRCGDVALLVIGISR